MEREKEKEQHEREEQKEQRESEENLREYQREKDEKDREFEIERMKFERDKMDFELQMKATEVKMASSVKSEDEEGDDSKEVSVASGHTRQRIGAKGPKMSCFDERSDVWIHSCIDLRYMQIAKDGVKSSGQYICRHF